MAEAYLGLLDKEMTVRSAGTMPATRVNPYAVAVMQEDGIDISGKATHDIGEYVGEPWDYVVTVCGGAREHCPVFSGRVGRLLHIGFDDPAEATGTDEEKLRVFRRVRDEIKQGFAAFYDQIRKVS